MKRRFPALVATALLAFACASTPPERTPLPAVDDVLEPAAQCTFLVGDPQGVLVDEVIVDSPADGLLLAGDVVVAVDAEATLDSAALLSSLEDKSPGEAIDVIYLRNGVETTGTLSLGANPDDPGRPMMGIMIRTRYQTIPADEAVSAVVLSPTTRPISIGDTIFLVDPVSAGWEKTETTVAADADWMATPSGLYTLVEGSLVDAISSDTIPHDGFDGWEPLRIIGSIGDDLVIVVSQPVPGGTETVRVAMSRFDPEEGTTVWVEPVVDGFGIPISALGSPDGETMVVTGVSEDGSELTGIDLLDGEGSKLGGDGLTALGTPVGWMDNRTLLFRTDNAVATKLVASNGTTEEVTLDDAVVGLPLFPVGDGRSVLAIDGQSLVLDDLDRDEEVRLLAENCPIVRVGDPLREAG